MLETVKTWFDWLTPYWPWIKPILFGYGGSIGLTQIFKFYLPGEITDETHKRRTRLMAAVLAAIGVWWFWPNGDAIPWAVTLGALCPLIVKGALILIYWKFPALEQRLSARPK